MKHKHIIFILSLVVASSCSQPQPEHQIETVSELLDSLMNRGEQVYRYIICGGDSSYQDERWFHYFTDGKYNEVQKDNLLFLEDKTPDLLDRLCKKAEKSYRYSEGDSLDYSITMSSKPLELLSFKSFRDKQRGGIVSLTHTNMRPVKYSATPYDATPIHAVLQKFLKEQKNVTTHNVCYEWDEGVPFTDFKNVQLVGRYKGIGADSLAAAKITGTLYDITIKGEGRADSANADLNNRMTKLITERPIKGAHLSSFYPGGKWKYYYMQGIYIFNWQLRRKLYAIDVETNGCKLYILELWCADAPRSAVPSNWWAVSRIHNDKVFFTNEYEQYDGRTPCYEYE